MELPSENGAKVANEWQPMSALIWVGPISRWASFIAAKTGRSGHPVQKFGGRGGISQTTAAMSDLRRSIAATRAATASASRPAGRVSDRKVAMPRKNASDV